MPEKTVELQILEGIAKRESLAATFAMQGGPYAQFLRAVAQWLDLSATEAADAARVVYAWFESTTNRAVLSGLEVLERERVLDESAREGNA